MKQKLLNSLRLQLCTLVALFTTAFAGQAWGETVTDVIDNAATSSALSNTGSTSWATDFTITGTSGAEYKIHSMGTKNSTEIAVQWNSNGYLYATKSGGILKSVKITTTTNAGTKKISVYAANTAYSAQASGTAINSLSATTTGATYAFTDSYSYIALNGTAASTSIKTIEIVWEVPSASATTTTIDATGITNTDVYASTAAGSLNATVSAVGSAISGATVTWSSSDEDVATIDASTGAVILVAAGTVTFTASYAGITDKYQASSATYELTVTDSTPSTDKWVETSLTDLTSSDVFVIVGNNGNNYALSNNNGIISAPTAVAVTVADGKITRAVADNIKWTISGNATDGYTFYPNGTTASWLYCTDTNNGVRVGTNDNKAFSIDQGYLKNNGTSRYVGVYNSSDWRCYTSMNNNIKSQTFTFYKRVDASTPDAPVISADNVTIAYDATNGSIAYTLTNPVEGTNLTASSSESWLTIGEISSTAVSFTCEANTGKARTATVTLTYGDVTKTVTVTQAAAPVIYTTIPALFAAATTTSTPVNVTFGNWVVSGVSTNGKNVFVTDNEGHGFVIFSNTDQSSTYAVDDILAGTAITCNLVLYNGFAEITDLDASDLTITTGGTVSTADIPLANLAGVNTGALVSYTGLTCSVEGTNYYLSDGTTSMQVYTSLYAFETLEAGKKYNVTGVYQQYKEKKEILPRSEDDIVEVQEASIVVGQTAINASASGSEGVITVTYNNITEVMAEVKFVAADGTTAASYEWVEAEIDADNNLNYTVSANTNTEARTAYLKVYALDDDANDVYSDLITITQAGFVADYATLPFSYDSTGAMITEVTGLTGNGLSSYTSGSPAIKFDGTGDWLILKMNEAPKALYFDIKGNDFSGGTFTVQTSADGTSYTDLATYTELPSEVQTEMFTNISTDVRYIKWIYTNKSKGNVALGNIIATNEAPITVTVGSALYTTFVAPAAVSFPENITAYIVTAINESSMHMEEVTEVPEGTPIVVKTTAAGTYTLTKLESAQAVTGNLLLASDGTVTGNGSTIYALGVGKEGDEAGIVGFYRVKSGAKVPAGKAYLVKEATGGNTKNYIAFDFGGADGIVEMTSDELQLTNVYNLAGQRLQKLQKGVNIVNGKKVLVK